MAVATALWTHGERICDKAGPQRFITLLTGDACSALPTKAGFELGTNGA